MLGVIAATIVVAMKERKPSSKRSASKGKKDEMSEPEAFGDESIDDTFPEQDFGDVELDSSDKS